MARKLKNWLKSYIEFTQFSEAPDKFHLWTGISALAGALRGKVEIDQGYFRWPSNFYIIFVSNPGVVNKTTTVNIGMKLLRQVPGILFGPDAITWQQLATRMSKSLVSFPVSGEEDIRTSSLTIASGEFGTLFDPRERALVDFLVAMWDGQIGVIKKETKTSGNDAIENAWLNIIACTTPAWVEQNFPSYFVGGGFTSRCIFVYADRKRKLVAYPGEVIPPELAQLEQDLVHDLTEISEMTGRFTLTREAIADGELWYTDHYYNLMEKPSHDLAMSGYYARKQTHMHKIAMLLSVSERSDMLITQEHLLRARTILEVVEADMPKVFGQIGRSVEARSVEQLTALVRSKGRISGMAAYGVLGHSLTAAQFDEVLKSAIRSGAIRIETNGNQLTLIAATSATSTEEPPSSSPVPPAEDTVA